MLRTSPGSRLLGTGLKWAFLRLLALGIPLATTLLGVGGASAQSPVQLIHPTTTSWHYHTNVLDPKYSPIDAWTALGFNDSSWPAGFGIFGRETTPAEYTDPSATYISCQCPFQTFISAPAQGGGVSDYFRTHINWTNSPGDVIFTFTNYVDDSVVVYLNGAVLYSFNVTAPLPMAWNNAAPSGAANPLGEGVPFVTNVIALGLLQGDNVIAAQLQQVATTSSDDVFTMSLWATPASPIAITQNLTNRTVPENRVVNITIGVAGSAPRYQWYRGTNPAVELTGETNATYTIPNSTVADTGDYFVVVTNSLNTVTSAVSHLAVVTDTIGPVLLSVKGDDTFQKIILTWDETVLVDSAGELNNYYILDPVGNQVFVNSVDYNGSSVVLHVPTLLPDTDYSVEVDFQFDLVGNLTLPVGTPVVDPNGIVANLHTFTFTRGFTRFQAYLDLDPAGTLDSFVASPAYPDGATFSFYTNVLYWPQTANPNVEQYAMRFTGLFVAPEDGTYHFDPAHDDSMRLRVYDGEDPNGTFTELAEACCNALTGGPTLDKDLLAGNRYYYELIVREFGGGDYAGIAVTLPSAAVYAPISPQYLAIAADMASAPNAGIAQQPQDQTTSANHSATFSVVVTNAGGSGASYQWQLDAGGGFADISGANGASYTTPLQSLADSGHQYRVLVTVPGRSITSSTATILVVNDTVPPHVLSVHGNRDLNAVTIFFDEVMDPGAMGEFGNYELTDSGNNVLALTSPVLAADNRSVTFSTPAQTAGAFYTLHAQDVPDLAGNPLAATNVTFQVWVYSRGFVLKELYLGLSTTTVVISDLRNSPNYPNSPSIVRYDSLIQLNTFDEFEGYGARISGGLVPPVSGDYTFYLASDDNGELWLSTDSDPGNIVNIANEPVWANRREWTGAGGGGGRVGVISPSGGPQANISGPIPLVAGQTYYFEALMKEGGGGDNLGVAWQLPGGPVPVNDSSAIGGFNIATLADPVGAVITFAQQPSSLTATQGQVGTMTVLALGTNANGSTPVIYQWQKFIGGAFTDIAGAVSSNYMTAALTAGDSGSQYRALVFIPGATATSSVATVTIGGGATQPQLSIRRSSANAVLAWPATATGFTAEGAPSIPTTTWTPVGPIVPVNGENTVTVPIVPGGNQFFRLRQ